MVYIKPLGDNCVVPLPQPPQALTQKVAGWPHVLWWLPALWSWL